MRLIAKNKSIKVLVDDILHEAYKNFNNVSENEYAYYENNYFNNVLESKKKSLSKLEYLEYKYYYVSYIIKRPTVPGCNIFDKIIIGTFFFLELMEKISPTLLKILKSKQFHGDNSLTIIIKNCSEAEIFAKKICEKTIENNTGTEMEFKDTCKIIKDYETNIDINSISIKNIIEKSIADQIGAIEWNSEKNSPKMIQFVNQIEVKYNKKSYINL